MTSPVLLFASSVTPNPLGGAVSVADPGVAASGTGKDFLSSFLQATQQSGATLNEIALAEGEDGFMLWQSPDDGGLLNMNPLDGSEFVSDLSVGLDETLLDPTCVSLGSKEPSSENHIHAIEFQIATEKPAEHPGVHHQMQISVNAEPVEPAVELTDADDLNTVIPTADGIPTQQQQLPPIAAEPVENPTLSLLAANPMASTSQSVAIPGEPSVTATASVTATISAELTQPGKRLDLTQWLSRTHSQMDAETAPSVSGAAIETPGALLKNSLFARAQTSQNPFAALDVATPETPMTESSRPATSLSAGPMAAEIVNNARVALPLQVTFGHPQWSEALAERAGWLAYQKIHTADIQLDPPELGPLQVKISVHQDQAVVTFVSGNAQVRDLLDQNLMRLRELLQEQGLQLLDAGVSDHQRESDDDTRSLASEMSETSIEDKASIASGATETPIQTELAWGVDDFA